MSTPKSDLLTEIAAAPALAVKLAAVRAGEAVSFEHVVDSAQPCLAALLARQAKARTWIVCADVRSQEALHNELLHWFSEALFFPAAEVAPVEGALPDPESGAERLGIVQRLISTKGQQIVVLTRASLEDEVPTAAALRQLEVRLKRSTRLDREKLITQLADAGYEHAPQITARGQFAVRGGILDVFSFHHALPVRIELFADDIESIREFDLDSQISVQHLDACTLLLGEAAAKRSTCHLRELIADADLTIDVDASWLASQVRIVEGGEGFTTEGTENSEGGKDGTKADDSTSGFSVPSVVPLQGEDFSTAFYDHGLGEFEAGDFVVDEIKRERFFSQLREWRTGGWRVHVFCNNEGEIERLRDLVPPVEADALQFTVGTLGRGFTCPAAKVAVLSDAELFGRYRNTRARRLALRRAREQASRAQIDFSELSEDDLVVHLEHGIGRYEGIKSIPRAVAATPSSREVAATPPSREVAATPPSREVAATPPSREVAATPPSRGEGAAATSRDEGVAATDDVLVIAFAGDARLYVPLEQSYLVSRYVGVGKKNPPLSTLGDGKWARAKKNAEKAVFDYAGKLLRIHAERETAKGFAFPPDNKWQREFEASFLFKETPDQLTAIAASKADMESEQPMDRLICGDVGFGKTEVAIRAAFKAVMGGKQVAILVPTTVLAEQHYRNFRERMSDYPITVELLSRFRTPGEQRKTVAGLGDGRVDIVVGTHRLISKDIVFKNLGLVVIDEEQRFGVLHKEKFKEMFQLVDMLTLSATPIPRTLYLSLMGAKDMSTIETAPLNRIPTETLICPYDERIIRDAIDRELARQGQVYFLHNRVATIEREQARIKRLCPAARTVIGHGQMDEHELEDVMHQFVSGAADVLISTTIIESGLDIPNANTIIIDRADRFGLADLYQLRGRVGRAQHKAYAYLLLPRDMMSQGEARKRINAIKQYSSLGAGFKIAMRDLEIRGAGNILGTQQSGHIVTIGFDLYCALLKQAIAKLKGEKVRPRLEVVLRTDFVATREAEYSEGRAPAPSPTSPVTPASGNRRGLMANLPAAPTSKGHGTGSSESHVSAQSAKKAPAFLPGAYIAESQPRIQAYRRLAEVTTQEQLDALRKTWRDRFGPLPGAAENLLAMTEIKLAAAKLRITVVEAREGKLMLTRGGDYILINGKFPRLSTVEPNARLREMLILLRSL